MGGRKPEGCLRKLSETCLKVFVVVLKKKGGGTGDTRAQCLLP